MIKQNISNKIFSIFTNNNIPLDIIPTLELPSQEAFGDYAINIAFGLAKKLKKSPKIIAEDLAQILKKDSDVGKNFIFTPINGFLNITFNDKYLWDEFTNLFTKKINFPKNKEKIHLEYVSANPTGPLHIGHGRWAVIGSVMVNIYKYMEFNIYSEFYVNNAGNQIQNLYKSIEAVKQNKPIPEDGYHGQYIQDIAKQTEDAVNIIIKEQKKTLSEFGVIFDNWFFESNLFKENAIEKEIKLLKEKNLCYEKENALFFKSSEFGDEKDRVLKKSDGKYTYFAVDIAYHLNKINRGFTKLINIWGADHHGYVERLKSAIKALKPNNFEVDEDFKIIIGQLVSLYRNGEPVRMSKRTGDMITLSEVIEEIGVDATRYFLLQKSADTHLDFDLELAKKKTAENPVYYIQYAHARICSIFSKLKELKITPQKYTFDKLELAERKLIFLSLQIYDEIYQAGYKNTPYKLANYALMLARAFHNFYEKCPILKADEQTLAKRYLILKIVQKNLQEILKILGISAPEKM